MRRAGQPRRSTLQYTGEREVYLPGRDKPVRRKTCLRFCPSVKVRLIVPIYELMDDPRTLWYQDEDFDRIRQQCSVIVSKAKSGK
eukprot:scaffold11360_cov64-Cylindrotheca_fusiformis.AAC.1